MIPRHTSAERKGAIAAAVIITASAIACAAIGGAFRSDPEATLSATSVSESPDITTHGHAADTVHIGTTAKKSKKKKTSKTSRHKAPAPVPVRSHRDETL
ncbi:MAG: hypothetical protein NC043_03610 [Muribaculaceae bacterium]|nr:hypothetical protein [Muribaculaceae bacterium]